MHKESKLVLLVGIVVLCFTSLMGLFLSNGGGIFRAGLNGKSLSAQVAGSGSSIQARWNFEGQNCSGSTVNDADLLAPTLNLSVSNTTWKDTSFYEGSCTMKWSSSGAYLSGGDVLDMGTGSRSVSFWFTTDTSDPTFTLVSKGAYASQAGRWYIAYCPSGTPATAVCTSGQAGLTAGWQGSSLNVRTSPGITTGAGGGSLANTSYPHVVAGWDRSGNLSLWVDGGTNGAPQATVNISADSAYNSNTASPFLLGEMSSPTSPYTSPYSSEPAFNGSESRMDDIRVYDRVLSAAEITDLYSGGPQRYNGAPTGTLPAGTTSTTVSLTTNVNATCKYSTTANTAYASMVSFATSGGTTGGTSHSMPVTGLTNGVTKNYYVRCSALNTVDYLISFSVASGDTTPPTVSITAPAQSATVSGTTVTVSADAADNIGVIGVQFKLDGALLGAEDTTAPYSITWDTTLTTNASHTLTAVARDATTNTTTSSSVVVTVLNSDLVAWWKLDETSGTSASDSSGTNTGTLVNVAPTWTTGKIDGGLSFDGINEYVTIPDSTSLRPASFTLGAWFKTPSFAVAQTIISKPRDVVLWDAPYTSWLVRVNNATVLEFGLSAGSYSGTMATVSALSPNTWYHIAMTYNGTTRIGYLNGSQVLSNAFTGPV